MSDVHRVGGCLTAGSLFVLGLAAWQVLVALLVGITIGYLLCNVVARPSQATGTPYPVISRVSFGVLGANVPAMATAVGAALAMLLVFRGSSDAASFSWFLGAGVAFALHWG